MVQYSRKRFVSVCYRSSLITIGGLFHLTRTAYASLMRNQNLFTVPTDFGMVHCVALDLRISKGIASVFQKKYGHIKELESHDPAVGGVLQGSPPVLPGVKEMVS